MLLVVRYWPLLASALICAAAWAAIRSVMRAPARRIALEALFAGYIAAVAYVVFFLPGAGADVVGPVWPSINLVPARTILGIVHDHPGMVSWQLVGNALLFVPLGMLLPSLGRRFRRFAATAATGLAVSAGIELVQLAMLLTSVARRSVDIDDVSLNVTGACLGFLVWRGARALAGSSGQRDAVPEDAS